MAWCTLYSWFHCVCLLFLKDLSLVRASPNKLGSFLEDLCKLKSFISTAAPSLTGFTGQLPTEYFLFFLYICLLENIIQILRKSSICASSLLFAERLYEFVLVSSSIMHYLQTRRNCTQCFLFDYHYSIVMNLPPTQTTHFWRTGIIEKSEISFSLSLPCYWIKRKKQGASSNMDWGKKSTKISLKWRKKDWTFYLLSKIL